MRFVLSQRELLAVFNDFAVEITTKPVSLLLVEAAQFGDSMTTTTTVTVKLSRSNRIYRSSVSIASLPYNIYDFNDEEEILKCSGFQFYPGNSGRKNRDKISQLDLSPSDTFISQWISQFAGFQILDRTFVSIQFQPKKTPSSSPQVRGGSAGVIESFYGVIKPIQIV